MDTGLRYHDYAALIALLHEDHKLRRSPSYPPAGSESFAATIDDYREMLRQWTRGGKRKSQELDSYLYNPCSHSAFGYSDLLELVLIDDVDPLFRLTTAPEVPLGQLTLAFCPTLESLGIPNGGAGAE